MGAWPELWYYDPHLRPDDERKRLVAWHAEVKDKCYDALTETLKYCRQDVEILRQACMTYRERFMQGLCLRNVASAG